MIKAIQIEINGLCERQTFKVSQSKDLFADASLVSGRFVLAFKLSENGDMEFRARFVVGEHRDKLKRLMAHTSQTIQPSPIRLLLTNATMLCFKIWVSDVT